MEKRWDECILWLTWLSRIGALGTTWIYDRKTLKEEIELEGLACLHWAMGGVSIGIHFWAAACMSEAWNWQRLKRSQLWLLTSPKFQSPTVPDPFFLSLRAKMLLSSFLLAGKTNWSSLSHVRRCTPPELKIETAGSSRQLKASRLRGVPHSAARLLEIPFHQFYQRLHVSTLP